MKGFGTRFNVAGLGKKGRGRPGGGTPPLPPPALAAAVLAVPVVNQDKSVSLACNDVGADLYRWFRDSVEIGTSTEPSFTDTGAISPPLSAGSITVTPGDAEIIISQSGAPSGGSGSYSSTLQHSEDGTTGWATVVTDPVYPYVHSGIAVVNGDIDYYRLAVSDGSSTVYTSVVSAMPQATVVGGTTYLSADFNDGTLQGVPWYHDRGGAITVIPDPTGSGRGYVVRIPYERTDTGTSEDVNAALIDRRPEWTYGATGYAAWDLYMPLALDPAPANVERRVFSFKKLNYFKAGAGLGDHKSNLILTLHARSDWSGWDLQVNSGSVEIPGNRVTEYTGIPYAWDTWHRTEMEFRVNDAGVANGWLKVYLDGVLRYTRTNFVLIDVDYAGPDAYFWDVLIGQQEDRDPDSAYSTERYVDHLLTRSTRP